MTASDEINNLQEIVDFNWQSTVFPLHNSINFRKSRKAEQGEGITRANHATFWVRSARGKSGVIDGGER